MSIARKIFAIAVAAFGLFVGAVGMTVPAFVAGSYFMITGIALVVAYVAWPKQPKVVYIKEAE